MASSETTDARPPTLVSPADPRRIPRLRRPRRRSPARPAALLKGAEQARLKIERGRMVLDVTNTSALFGTGKRRLTAVFDGARRRTDYESRALETDWIRGDVHERAPKRRRLEELRGGPDAIVRDGLGSWRDSRERAILDGTRLTRFGSINGGGLTVVDNPREMRGGEAFDPRVLGLSIRSSSLRHCAEIWRTRGRDGDARGAGFPRRHPGLARPRRPSRGAPRGTSGSSRRLRIASSRSNTPSPSASIR